jgi:hypothetical protein
VHGSVTIRPKTPEALIASTATIVAKRNRRTMTV